MKQLSFLSLAKRKELRKDKFLKEMNGVIPWNEIIEEIRPYYQYKELGRKKTNLLLILKIYFLQQWYNLSDPSVEEEIHDRYSFQKFLDIDLLKDTVPDETTLLHFRHLLEQHGLQKKIFDRVRKYLEDKDMIMRVGSIVDATIIHAPSSTKNTAKKRDRDMGSTKKGNNYHFGMKVHIGVDSSSGMVHSLETTSASVHDSSVMDMVLHGNEKAVFADKAYANREKKKRAREKGLYWGVLDKGARSMPLSCSQEKKNKKHSMVRSKVEHVFRVLKCQFGYGKVRYKGMEKNRMNVYSLMALTNLYIARRCLLKEWQCV